MSEIPDDHTIVRICYPDKYDFIHDLIIDEFFLPRFEREDCVSVIDLGVINNKDLPGILKKLYKIKNLKNHPGSFFVVFNVGEIKAQVKAIINFYFKPTKKSKDHAVFCSHNCHVFSMNTLAIHLRRIVNNNQEKHLFPADNFSN